MQTALRLHNCKRRVVFILGIGSIAIENRFLFDSFAVLRLPPMMHFGIVVKRERLGSHCKPDQKIVAIRTL